MLVEIYYARVLSVQKPTRFNARAADSPAGPAPTIQTRKPAASVLLVINPPGNGEYLRFNRL